MRNIVINANDAGQRLDKFLTKAVKGLPQSLMYKYLRTKKIKLNGKRTLQNVMLNEGDEIQLYIRDEFFSSPEKDDSALERISPKIDVVYEDENIMLINKRQGVLVHEDKDGGENTLIMHIKAYLYKKGEYDPEEEQSFTPALCNRIDRNTGGIVIAAKNAAALREMNEKIRNDSIKKYYLCAVSGILRDKKAELRGWLVKDSASNTVTVYDKEVRGSKNIITRYKVVAESEGNSLLEVELVTGRTHQIRAHMAHVGHPLLGDGKYGINRNEKKRGYKFQALYSYKVKFLAEKEEERTLKYLDGREISVDPSKIWFVGDIADTEQIKRLSRSNI